jgi:SAM-dependent methyltransferase
MDERRCSPSVGRNKDAILAVLRTVLPPEGAVLEVGCGTGEHAVHFAGALPGLDWQPSDRDPAALESTAAWVAHAALPNLRPPIALDTAGAWPELTLDAVFTANTIHYSPWETTPGLLAGAAGALRPGGVLVLYGPFRFGGVLAPESNVRFEGWLKAQDPRFGVRDLDDLARLGGPLGLRHEATHPMPANNHVLVFRRV